MTDVDEKGDEVNAESPRGRWVDKDRKRTWEGPFTRTESRGEAILAYRFDRPCRVSACLLADGTRGEAMALMGAEAGEAGWRRQMPDGSWRHGRIDVREDEVRFIDVLSDAVRRERRKSNRPDLEWEILSDERLGTLSRDDVFAGELYAAMCNMDWVTLDGANADEPWSCSWRHAGGIVADLRKRGEEYVDFYCGGGEGTVTRRIRDEMGRLGWSPLAEE